MKNKNLQNVTDLKFYSIVPNFGRTRETMPQINPNDITDFLLHFSSKGINIKKVSYPLNKLRPAQKDINLDKVRSKLMANDINWKNRIFIISQDKFILDGHHDFATGLEQDENFAVNCYKICLPINKLLKISNHLKITTKEDMAGNKLNEAATKLIINVLNEAKKNNASKITGDKKVLYSAAQNRERERAKEQGFYDGRFRSKTEKDKSKYDPKKERQKKFSIDEAEENDSEDLSQYGIKELKNGLNYQILKTRFSWIFVANIKDAVISSKKINGKETLIWHSGIWLDGSWTNGIWESGTWYSGIWHNGIWKNGTFKAGTWENGTWFDGIFESANWKQGKWYNGTFEGGNWKYGKWYGGEWKKGVWEGGEWVNGTWFDGTWKGGWWFNGEWKGGNWKDGWFMGFKSPKLAALQKNNKK